MVTTTLASSPASPPDSIRVVERIGSHALPAALHTAERSCAGGVVTSGALDASAAGARILRAGGNAVDAAVATAFALGVAEPAASGLGGQTHLLVHLADGRDIAVDGSATVPFRVVPGEVVALREAGTESDYRLAATPGSVAALTHALSRFGTLSLAEVLAPAIELAEFGCRMTVTEQVVIATHASRLRQSPLLGRVFLDADLEPYGEDHVYCRDRLAATLRRLAVGGAEVFYRGDIAAAIASDMEAHGGWVSAADLAAVRAVERTPLRGRYRGHEVISFPYPGGGGAVIEALQILDALPASRLAEPGIDRLTLLAEAARIALLDGFWGNRPAAATTVMQVDPFHAARRAAQLRPDRPLTLAEIVAGLVSPWHQQGTTQISVIDAAGNAVSLTQTVGAEFGSGVATDTLGFPYNSLLLNFASGNPSSRGYPRPGRAPMVTMAPTMVLHGGTPWLVLGGAGSGRLTSTVVDTVSNVVDLGLDIGEAVAAPRVLWDYSDDPRFMLELAGPPGTEEADELAERGWTPLYRLYFPPRPIDLLAFGGVNAVLRDPVTGALTGAADPRRYGGAATPCEP